MIATTPFGRAQLNEKRKQNGASLAPCTPTVAPRPPRTSRIENFQTYLRVGNRRRGLRPAAALLRVDRRRRAGGIEEDVLLPGGGLLVYLCPADTVEVQLLLDRHRSGLSGNCVKVRFATSRLRRRRRRRSPQRPRRTDRVSRERRLVHGGDAGAKLTSKKTFYHCWKKRAHRR
jgi:hypothetical protein